MNKIDIKNIKAIIDWKLARPKFEKGGDIPKSANLYGKSITDLKKMIEENSVIVVPKVRNCIDKYFEKIANRLSNTIILWSVNRADWTDTLIQHEEESYDIIDFDYAMKKQDSGLFVADPIDIEDQSDIAISNQWELYDELKNAVIECGCDDAEKAFEDSEAINPEWYGVVAVTRDYKLIHFVIRDDGAFVEDFEVIRYF